jgi:toxin ParE1/3/4
MIYKIVFSKIAVKNIDDAFEYYSKAVSNKLSNDFLIDLNKSFYSLEINPFYQFHDKNYRFLPLKKFPFVLFFIVDEIKKMVYVNAVFHTSQNPSKFTE